MSELLTSRYQFRRGSQKKFIEKVLEKKRWTIADMAKKLGVCERTIRDWRREEVRISCHAAVKLSKLSKIVLPKPRKVITWSEHAKKAGKIGGIHTYEKYGRVCGSESYRKEKWKEWWKKEGHLRLHSSFGKEKEFFRPEMSVELAEICGILLGDGCIGKSQIRVTLNRFTDAEYVIHVQDLLKRVFHVAPAVYQFKDETKRMVKDVTLSRVGIIKYLSSVGLFPGNKVTRQVDIPGWILNNDEYALACVRGLIDTDGCIFTHSYKVNGKMYCYKKIAFTNRSKPLLNSVYNIMKSIGLHPRFSTTSDVRLDSIRDVRKYMQIFGTHNKKHLKRYQK